MGGGRDRESRADLFEFQCRVKGWQLAVIRANPNTSGTGGGTSGNSRAAPPHAESGLFGLDSLPSDFAVQKNKTKKKE